MKSSFGVCRFVALVALLAGLASNVLAMPGPTGNPPNPAPVPAGLISWWQGETNANDFMGLNNGVLENGVGFAPGEVGQAFDFTETNQTVMVPASPSLNVGLDSGFTLEAWINPADVSQAYPIFGWNAGSNFIFGVQFQILAPGALYAAIEDTNGSANQLVTQDGVLTTNVFQHVALTFDKASGLTTIYCNGQIVNQYTYSNIVPQTSYNFYIGGQPTADGAYQGYIGEIDEAAIYNRALSSNEVAAIYNAGNLGKSTSGIAPEILTQPAGQTVLVGGTATFSVVADGPGPLSYQWLFAGTNIAGATGATLTLTNLNTKQGGYYEVKVSSPYGATNSAEALLTLSGITPEILTQPAGQTALVGGTVTFSVVADGPGPLSYQWLFAGRTLPVPLVPR